MKNECDAVRDELLNGEPGVAEGRSRRRFLATFAIGALGVAEGAMGLTAAERGRVRVVSTIGMIADLVKQVGGDRVVSEQLMGPGVDPHLYKPTARDVSRLQGADVILHVGLMLEGRMGEVLERMAKRGKKVSAVTSAVGKDRLLQPKGFEGHADPHLWFDVGLWAECVSVIRDALIAVDGGGRDEYEKRATVTRERMAELHRWCLEQASTLPKEKRVLVTSHDAYNYFGRAYGFRVVGLQGVSTVSEASLSDVAKLVDFIKQQGVKAIFVETSVAPATIQRVSKDAGVRIGGELYSDAMGEPGEKRLGYDTGTYDGMVRYNMTTIVEALR